MKVYRVGGAVRDKIMGHKPKDYDYVVVGSSPKDMVSRGFTPVGKSFPVFLHPTTGEEYALARTEKKVAAGHNGFETKWEGVTLEEDLMRRDLTINAIAMDMDTGYYIDPCGGITDIKNKVLRPATEAFKEDPIRVLRAGRFLARYPDFTYSSDLVNLSSQVIGEICQCAPDRVWKELEKVFSENKPSRFFDWMALFDFFPIWSEMNVTPQVITHHPEKWVDIHTKLVMDYAAEHFKDPEIVFACFAHDFGKPECFKKYGNALGHEEAGLEHIINFCEQWKVPNYFKDLALITCQHHTKVHGCMGRNTNDWTRPKSIMKLFEDTNAIGKPERFVKMLKACCADARGRGNNEELLNYYRNKPYPQMKYLQECLINVLSLNTKEITIPLLEKGKKGVDIGEAVRVARIQKIREVQYKWKVVQNPS